MLEEKYISKELSYLAFDFGFECHGYSIFNYENKWRKKDDTYFIKDLNWRIPNKYWDSKLRYCPLSLLQKWFRDNHNLHIEIELASDCELNIFNPYIYQFSIYKDCNYHCDREFYESYEECLEAAMVFSFSLLHGA